MKPKKLFSILFPSYFLISVIGLIFLLIITRFAIKSFYFKQTTTGLIQKAKLIEKDLKKLTLLTVTDGHSNIQSTVKEISEKSESRITIILTDGKVIADSSYDPTKMEDHSNRPEIKEAMRGSVGTSLRYSNTLQKELLYVAIPMIEKGATIGVLRNAVSVGKLQVSLYEFTKNVIFWSLLLLIILTYFIYNQAKKISQPLEQMKTKVEAFANSEFQEKIPHYSAQTEEVSSLFNALEKMSEKIDSQFNKINKQKNEQLAVFGSMLEGVITIYPDMNIYHINHAALKLFDYQTTEPIKGTPLEQVVKSNQIYDLAKNLLQDHQTVEDEFEHDSGLVLNVHGTILQSKETGMLGAVLVFNDITKVRELQKHRKQFVANVSHELKTPLTAIQGYLETIQEEDIDDKETMDKFISIIHRHANRLKRIIEDLLALSSIEKDEQLEVHPNSIHSLLNNVKSLLSEKASKKEIDIEISGKDQQVLVNSPLIEQAIINLVDNSIKYSPSNTIISINTEVSMNMLNIIVHDQGPGIDKKHHDRLFERFYSVDKARSRELGGSGLGLSIVKHIALSHHGNVFFDKENQNGSRFVFQLPLDRS